MTEALLLFQSILLLPWFERTSFVLALTKVDLFEEKLPHSPVSRYFPDYTGSDLDSESVRNFFIRKFLALNHEESTIIHVLCVDATNTDHVRKELRKIEELVSGRAGSVGIYDRGLD